MTPEYRIETEKRIKEYFKSFKINKILSIKCVETFNDLDNEVNVWDVKTNKGAWWVVEGEYAPMNLYSQDGHYFSADEAYSFHLGITQRLTDRNKKDFKHIIEEIPLDIEQLKSINRKLNVAAQQLSVDLEPEEFQAIGLICRESLIDLSKELYKRNPEIIKQKGLKKSDFKEIAHEFISLYIPGDSNSDLRNYSRKVVDFAWDYCSTIVHSPNKTYPDVKIALLFTASAVSLLENLFYKFLGFDGEFACSECGSKKLEFLKLENGDLIAKCSSCGGEQMLKQE